MTNLLSDVDVIVIGAGISGISAGYYLQEKCPDRRYLILEGRQDLGGTWDLFSYPGIRSDSDMHTLGFKFKPWTGSKSITDGPSILAYIREAAAEYDINKNIRFGHHVTEASWSSETSQWTVLAHCKETGDTNPLTCRFLFICTGYYSYDGGYLPKFRGIESFEGKIVHPQIWPEHLDYKDKHVVVIGSGATAVTLVPAMAETAAHVTMLQRSPSYVVAMPDRDIIADRLRQFLPEKMAYRLVRWKNIKISEFFYGRTRSKPEKVRRFIRNKARKELGAEFDIDTHFNPSYNPWDQRLCLIPNGDLFVSLKQGKASIVTEKIDAFVPDGIRLASGDILKADIIVTATGLKVVAAGGINLSIDGERINFPEHWTYKGVAYSDVPNLVSTFGYINASWTLRAEMVSEYVCRLLNQMHATGTDVCMPKLRRSDQNMPKRPLISDFSSGYIQRALPLLPHQGDRDPWTCPQSYSLDRKALLKAPIDDGVMTFSRHLAPAHARPIELTVGPSLPE